MKKIVLLCFAMIGLTAQAQTDGLTLKVGVTLPTNLGTSSETDEPTGMSLGYSAGVRFQHLIGNGNLHYYAEVDARWNGLSKDSEALLNKTKKLLDASYGYDREEATSTMKGSTYWNIPLLVGLNYSYPIMDAFSVWGEIGTGVVYRITTNQKYHGQYSYSQNGTVGQYSYMNTYTKKTDMTTAFNNAVHWAVHCGLGISLNERFSLGVNYDWFYGSTTMKTSSTTTLEKDYNSGAGHNHTTDTDNSGPTIVKGDASSSAMFTIKVGYSF